MRIIIQSLFAGLILISLTFSIAEVGRKDRQNKSTPQQPKKTYILCDDLTAEVLEGTKISTKKIPEGIIIVITSSDQDAVKEIQNIIYHCKKRRSKKLSLTTTHELLMNPKINLMVAFLNNGIRLELNSDNANVVKKIHQITIPGYDGD